jgi:hypothetical protein
LDIGSGNKACNHLLLRHVDSDHSLCIENELETIKTTLDKVVKRDDIENIVSSIMGKLVINLKKEIK